jgi:ATP-dependent exoDNAse (exonuclease V) alpha subunit
VRVRWRRKATTGSEHTRTEHPTRDAPEADSPLKIDVRLDVVEDGRAVFSRPILRLPSHLTPNEPLRDLSAEHRRGQYGVSSWMSSVELWLAREISAAGGPTGDYPGRPLLITANDYDLNLFNGDSGVVVLGAWVANAPGVGGSACRAGSSR